VILHRVERERRVRIGFSRTLASGESTRKGHLWTQEKQTKPSLVGRRAKSRNAKWYENSRTNKPRLKKYQKVKFQGESKGGRASIERWND